MSLHYSTKLVRVLRTEDRNGVRGHVIEYFKDGYQSWCPLDVFARDYQSVEAMDFGHALHALKNGNRVARQGWNGKAMWLSLSGMADGTPVMVSSERFWSQHNAIYAEEIGGSAPVLPAITMKNAKGQIVMGWLASQEDMLANDWMVVT